MSSQYLCPQQLVVMFLLWSVSKLPRSEREPGRSLLEPGICGLMQILLGPLALLARCDPTEAEEM